MRGDRPKSFNGVLRQYWFTPHARGSTLVVLQIDLFERVYPACAGIDRPLRLLPLKPLRLPRMRGDRP